MIQPRVATYNGFAKFLSLDLVAFFAAHKRMDPIQADFEKVFV